MLKFPEINICFLADLRAGRLVGGFENQDNEPCLYKIMQPKNTHRPGFDKIRKVHKRLKLSQNLHKMGKTDNFAFAK